MTRKYISPVVHLATAALEVSVLITTAVQQDVMAYYVGDVKLVLLKIF